MRETERPAVSVVLVFLDEQDFLKPAIESVLAQSYHDWELLLVDDGSSDGSTEIARGWAARHPERIRFLEHPGHENRGISATRNLGVLQSQGAWVALIDGDDMWMPEKLAAQMRIVDENPQLAMTYCKCLYWWSWDSDPARQDELLSDGAPQDRQLDPPALLSLLVSNEARPALPSSLFFRRQAARAVGGFEESFRGMYEDQVFTAKMAATYPVWASSQCLAKYRQHAGSISAANRRVGQTRMARARIRYLDWLGGYLERTVVTDPAVWREWRRQTWMYRHFRGDEPASGADSRLDLWRWLKKWALKVERTALPEGIRRHLWSPPKRESGR